MKAAPTSIPPLDLACAPPIALHSSTSLLSSHLSTAESSQLSSPLSSHASELAPQSRASVALMFAYLRSQLVAGLATLIDFAVVVGGVEKLHMYYLAATALGAVMGGVTAFVGNRHWSFLATHGRLSRQSLRYALVWAGSITLNCALVYAMTDGASVQYAWSKVLTAIAVGACFNFPLHRWYVFR